MDVIIGTAGHIDHGKTALVKALTGTDADRLPEEKRRGITVDLGFAEMNIGDMHFGFVDVPGHERFVKNMLAGASGIDIVLLVIAADEGVMPQTREHFDICRLLGIKSGVIALTKSDLVDDETLELAKLDAAELVAGSFLENAPVIALSSKTGQGIDELKQAIIEVSGTLGERQDRYVTRLPIDRSFSMKGFGAVVTGTLASGKIHEGDELELLPDIRKVRVRGLQTHGRAAKTVHSGQRVAVNLAGVNHDEIERSMTLAAPSTLIATQIIDAEIEVLPDAPRPLRSRARIRVHIGTAEILARIQILNQNDEIAAGTKNFAQIRFESPIVAVPFERFIIRSYSPQITIAGGRVVDVAAQKYRRKDSSASRNRLQGFLDARDDASSLVRLLVNAAGDKGLNFNDLQLHTGLKTDILNSAIGDCLSNKSIVEAGGHYVDAVAFEALSNAALNSINEFHKRNPLASGMPLEALRDTVFAHLPDSVFRAVIKSLEAANKVEIDKESVLKAGQSVELSASEASFIDKLKSVFERAALDVAKVDDIISEARLGVQTSETDARKLLHLLIKSGDVVKVTDEFYFATDAINALKSKVRAFADASDDRLIDVAKFKDIAGVSRKYAIPLLEYFDREKVTVRAGDKRLVL